MVDRNGSTRSASDEIAGGRPPGPRRQGWRRVATVIVAFVTFAAAAAFAWSALRESHDGAASSSTSAPGRAAVVEFPEGWTELPAPPVYHDDPVAAWTGQELVLWGGNERDGDEHYADGFAFDPAASAWRRIAASPLVGRSWPAAAWTGEELVIWGGSHGSWAGASGLGDGAAYDPISDTWRMIAPAPVPPNSPIVTAWTGRELVVWGSYRGDAAGTGAAYEPATDTWRTIADPPIALNDVNTVWSGAEVFAFGANLGAGNHAETPFAVGAAYDPATDTWRTLPPSELSPQASDVAWTGSSMLAADYLLDVAAYDPSADAWQPVPRLPTNACEGYPQLVNVGDVIVAEFCGELVSHAPGDDRWHVILGRGEEGPFGSLFSGDFIEAGDVAFVIGDSPPEERGRMFAFRPEVPAGGTTARDAWDLAAAFAALRSHYPYEEGKIPARVEDEMSAVVSSTAAWDSREQGLRAFWDYYTGFEVLGVEETASGLFAVTVSLYPYNGNQDGYHEILQLAPGTGLDGRHHDLVIVDAQAG
jgi:hypothetical protein